MKLVLLWLLLLSRFLMSVGLCTNGTYRDTSENCSVCPPTYSQPDTDYTYCEFSPPGYYNPPVGSMDSSLVSHLSFWGTNPRREAVSGQLCSFGADVEMQPDGAWVGAQSAKLKGTTGSIITAPSVNVGTSGYTVCAWVQVSMFYSDLDTHIIRLENTNHKHDLTIQPAAKAFSHQWKTTGYSLNVYNDGTTINTAQWFHSCFALKATSAKHFRNGALVKTTTGTFTVNNINTVNVYIGRITTTTWHTLTGGVDDIRIYKQFIDSASAIYSDQNILPCPVATFQSQSGATTCETCFSSQVPGAINCSWSTTTVVTEMQTQTNNTTDMQTATESTATSLYSTTVSLLIETPANSSDTLTFWTSSGAIAIYSVCGLVFFALCGWLCLRSI